MTDLFDRSTVGGPACGFGEGKARRFAAEGAFVSVLDLDADTGG